MHAIFIYTESPTIISLVPRMLTQQFPPSGHCHIRWLIQTTSSQSTCFGRYSCGVAKNKTPTNVNGFCKQSEGWSITPQMQRTLLSSWQKFSVVKTPLGHEWMYEKYLTRCFNKHSLLSSCLAFETDLLLGGGQWLYHSHYPGPLLLTGELGIRPPAVATRLWITTKL